MKSSSKPQKATSTTKLSKSPTANSAGGLDTPIQFVKGVGPKLAISFQKKGIETVRDLLLFFPRSYEDRTQLSTVKSLVEGQKASVQVQITGMKRIPLRGRRHPMLEFQCQDPTGKMALKYFNAFPGIDKRLAVGTTHTIIGTPKFFRGQAEIIHPEVVSGSATESTTERIVPVYVEIDGVSNVILRKVLWAALESFVDTFQDDIPEVLVSKHSLPSLKESIRALHYPPAISLSELSERKTPFHKRLIYEEFLKFEFLVLKNRLAHEKEKAIQVPIEESKRTIANALSKFPFELTGAQKQTLSEILADLNKANSMNRLVQGDVGSGKTAVALLAAAAVIQQGYQAALMAPTEILAEQHFQNCLKLMGSDFPVELLTGRTTQKERRRIQDRLNLGTPMLLLGTHALIEPQVRIPRLNLVLIDEQHRFGVEQRKFLRAKSEVADLAHILLLTATPIPRTLALTVYGDLAVSTISELPPGRTPIRSRIVRTEGDRAKLYEFVKDQIRKGRQAYFIYSLVNESESEGFEHLKDAETHAAELAGTVFSEFRIGLLHGRMTPEEKTQVMNRFKNRECDLLVSTTVVEVGVDVPNATVMVVENSERFGLSQLHQLRGRIGRSSHSSYFFMMLDYKSGEDSKTRMEILEQTQDGFKIAEADLEIRGPGQFMGTKQSGDLPFRLASLVRDQAILLQARDDALEVMKSDAPLERPENQSLRKFMNREGQTLAGLLGTG